MHSSWCCGVYACVWWLLVCGCCGYHSHGGCMVIRLLQCWLSWSLWSSWCMVVMHLRSLPLGQLWSCGCCRYSGSSGPTVWGGGRPLGRGALLTHLITDSADSLGAVSKQTAAGDGGAAKRRPLDHSRAPGRGPSLTPTSSILDPEWPGGPAGRVRPPGGKTWTSPTSPPRSTLTWTPWVDQSQAALVPWHGVQRPWVSGVPCLGGPESCATYLLPIRNICLNILA